MGGLNQKKDVAFFVSGLVAGLLAVVLLLSAGIMMASFFYHGENNAEKIRRYNIAALDQNYKKEVVNLLTSCIDLIEQGGDVLPDDANNQINIVKKNLLALKVSAEMKDYHLNLVLLMERIGADKSDQFSSLERISLLKGALDKLSLL